MITSLLAQGSFWLDPPASTGAVTHDLVFYALLYTMAFFFFLVIGIMLLFVVLYRRRKGQHPQEGPTHNTPMEVSWTIIPLVVVAVFFVIGLKYYVDIEAPPPGADVVDVEASQWQFNFRYPNGAESDELYLQVDRPVVLKLTSKDVSHALYIPAFRVQRNAVPGQNTEIWFKPTLHSGHGPLDGRGRLLPRLLHAILWHQSCRDARQGLRDEEGGLRQEADRRGQYFRRQGHKNPLPYAEVGKNCSTRATAPSATDRRQQGNGPDLERALQEHVNSRVSNVPGYYAHERRRRQEVGRLPPRIDPPSRGQDRQGINANGNPFGKRNAFRRRPASAARRTKRKNCRRSSNTSRAWEIQRITSR